MSDFIKTFDDSRKEDIVVSNTSESELQFVLSSSANVGIMRNGISISTLNEQPKVLSFDQSTGNIVVPKDMHIGYLSRVLPLLNKDEDIKNAFIGGPMTPKRLRFVDLLFNKKDQIMNSKERLLLALKDGISHIKDALSDKEFLCVKCPEKVGNNREELIMFYTDTKALKEGLKDYPAYIAFSHSSVEGISHVRAVPKKSFPVFGTKEKMPVVSVSLLDSLFKGIDIMLRSGCVKKNLYSTFAYDSASIKAILFTTRVSCSRKIYSTYVAMLSILAFCLKHNVIFPEFKKKNFSLKDLYGLCRNEDFIRKYVASDTCCLVSHALVFFGITPKISYAFGAYISWRDFSKSDIHLPFKSTKIYDSLPFMGFGIERDAVGGWVSGINDAEERLFEEIVNKNLPCILLSDAAKDKIRMAITDAMTREQTLQVQLEQEDEEEEKRVILNPIVTQEVLDFETKVTIPAPAVVKLVKRVKIAKRGSNKPTRGRGRNRGRTRKTFNGSYV